MRKGQKMSEEQKVKLIESKTKEGREKYEGMKCVSNEGCNFIVSVYRNCMDCDFLFEDNTLLQHRGIKEALNGCVKNPNFRKTRNKGFKGEGEFQLTHKNKKYAKLSNTWNGLLSRTVALNKLKYYPAYDGCTLCDEWENYQTFCDWYSKESYQVDDELMVIDKDILFHHNKHYSPNTVLIVTDRINKLFIKTHQTNGLPVGVRLSSSKNKFVAECYVAPVRGIDIMKGENRYLGSFNTVDEAFNAYKQAKEKYIKRVAEIYKDKIPEKVYNALINYEVMKDDYLNIRDKQKVEEKINKVPKDSKYLGMTFQESCNDSVEVIEYYDYKNVKVKFLSDNTILDTSMLNVRRGKLINPNKIELIYKKQGELHMQNGRQKNLGFSNVNKYGEKYTVVEYFGYYNVTVKFEDGTIVTRKDMKIVKNGLVYKPKKKNM